ncbi:interleukin-5 receptor subunit alpha-like [Carcharodon carcharias]|uniref:interleukin-5 receptor subunit alpha-like n=1 Tax=Carcharodon carcharias TaxID=13397 RepID=UPI001B7DFC09|nr:interleukin-5 receptor subunit alpha-like [Carcharodon carcharias]
MSTMFLLAPCLAISFVLPIMPSNGSQEFQANITELNPPTNITVTNRQLGELTFTWNDNLSEGIKNQSKVRYRFEFKYSDLDSWQEDSRLLSPEYVKTFELHRGVSVRIQNVLLDNHQNQKMKSDWTVKDIQSPPDDPETLISNFSCIVYNHSSMNCTWRKGRKAPTDTQYTMYYRQEETTRKCTHYFTDVHGRQGCHVDQGRVYVEENILICINGSSDSSTIPSYYTEFDPWDYEMYNPPVNLTVLPNLTVKWDKPSGYDVNPECFQFQLKVTDMDEGRTEFSTTTDESKYVLVNINPTKRYSVKVRMKLKHCQGNKIWSDWSNEGFIGPIHLFNVHQMLLIVAMFTMAAGLLLLFAFRRCKVLETVFKPIPDPQKKFKTLFEEYNGDFQNWINYQIPISKADECHPVVIEENPKAEA